MPASSYPRDGRAGFTLVELLVVVLIIGVLATIAIPVFNGQRAKAKHAASQSAARQAVNAGYSWWSQNNDFDDFTLNSGEASLIDGGYTSTLRASASADPQRIQRIAFCGTSTTCKTVAVCSISRAQNVYCAAMGDFRADGVTTGTDFAIRYGKTSGTVSDGIIAAFGNVGW